jgi:two-component system CheB/CheR fusion protein
MRILIADDCPDNRDSLALLLRAWGFEVLVAADGISALEAFRTFAPHAAILDIAMPGLDGWDVARQVRGGDSTVLLIALSGHAREQDVEQSRLAGFDVHLVKPVEPSEIRRLLESHQNLVETLPPEELTLLISELRKMLPDRPSRQNTPARPPG